ncbi:hypothetical protein K4039_03835 [Lyngbya sp. CCAP 1446/10]|uniref:hypothetical protein n=1 Tax=Lyngbya sp. CCAP 1446/10 TaxID=439293 RepID=UPI0022379C78|nr:hypothetical protein [Lyngbya sp. CCAP 1446/10]MCW6049235.1 hypothetical protein [Lyngbya sp. CCAP 1446/10]
MGEAKRRDGAWGIGHGELGIGHRASGIGHWHGELGMGHRAKRSGGMGNWASGEAEGWGI